jgi:hypothetical protein
MSRQIAISLVGATAIGIGLVGMSSAFAAPANGTVIGEAALNGGVTQKVIWRGGWRGGAGWRGVGWRGVGWRGVGWRGVGWRGVGWRGVGWRGVGWRGVGWRGVGWRDRWHPGWRYGWGWRPGLAAAGVAAAGIAATAASDNDGYGYGYGNYGFGYTTATYPRYMCCYTVVPGYENTAAGFGDNYYGAYSPTGLGAAAVGAADAGATTRVAQNETALYRYRHNFARER